MSRDADLRRDIETQLEFEPTVTSASIGVAVKDGVVTLTGHVPSYMEKTDAERAAGRVKGVRAIVEKLEVRLPSDVKHDDEEIARRASNICQWDTSAPVSKAKVKVEKGWVTLTGEVEGQYQKQMATDAVRRLAGVVGVTNAIAIRPRVVANDVRDRITKAYERSADLEASGIQISVSGGKVNLQGHVKTWGDRVAAENAAWAVPGVTHVTDNLVVG